MYSFLDFIVDFKLHLEHFIVLFPGFIFCFFISCFYFSSAFRFNLFLLHELCLNVNYVHHFGLLWCKKCFTNKVGLDWILTLILTFNYCVCIAIRLTG